MKRLVAFTALLSGLLLILVPRYILPACEYEGYPPMHCSDTARAEYLVGAALMVIGGVSLYFKKNVSAVIGAVTAGVLYGVAFWLPDKIGYCHSTRMPCNYGMIPGIRFISITGTLIMIGAVVGLLRTSRKKGTA
jgi:hypothetical protein